MLTQCKNPVLWIMLSCFICISSLTTNAQDSVHHCSEIKSGVFHYYPVNTSTHIIVSVNNSTMKEVDPFTHTTGISEIKWVDDCSYIQKFVSTNGELDKKTEKFLNNHVLFYRVEKVTAEYYTFKGYIDKPSGTLLQSDTMWRMEKPNFYASTLFEQVKFNNVRKLRFSDTSKYALVYVYRPGKLTNSLSEFPVYLNDNVICSAKNKSGFVFKVFKDGEVEFKGKLLKDESAVKVNISFGHVYYIKSVVHWGMHKGFRNYKLEMAEVAKETGAEEFTEVDAE